LANFRYLVDDVDVALAFYVEKLGFEALERWGPPFAMARRDDVTLWLSGPGSSAARALADGSKPAPGGWNRLVLEVGNLDAMVESLAKAGVSLRGGIVSGPGGKQVIAEDPAGNPIELFEPAEP
jgi:catechol 2,3-dioxygenase-like lactoylglutathione lyase family enzyme